MSQRLTLNLLPPPYVADRQPSRDGRVLGVVSEEGTAVIPLPDTATASAAFAAYICDPTTGKWYCVTDRGLVGVMEDETAPGVVAVARDLPAGWLLAVVVSDGQLG